MEKILFTSILQESPLGIGRITLMNHFGGGIKAPKYAHVTKDSP